MASLSILHHTRNAILRFSERLECPLFEREFYSYGRMMRSVALRFFYPVIIILAIVEFIYLFADFFEEELLHEVFLDSLRGLCRFAGGLQIGALFVSVAFSPQLLSREREDNGLEFLLLTGMRPSGIYWSKYLSVLWLTVSLILVPVPILAFGQGLGVVGVAWPLTRMALLLGHGAVLAALGLLAGAYTRKTGDAMFVFVPAALIWLAGWAFAQQPGLENPLVQAQNAFWHSALKPRYLPDYAFAGALALSLLVAAGLSLLTCRRLARLAQPEPPRTARSIRPRTKPLKPSVFGPLVSFAVCNGIGLSAALRHRRLAIPVAIAWCLLAAWQPLAAIPALLFFAYDMGSTAALHAREGMLLDMLLTPATDRSLARLLLIAYARHAWLYTPAMAAGYVRTVIAFQTIQGGPTLATKPVECVIVTGILFLGLVCGVVAVVLAAANFGFQTGEAARGAILAPLAAIGLLMIPHFIWSLRVFADRVTDWSSAVRGWFFLPMVITFTWFFWWYYRKYANSLRAALFEDKATREKNL